MNYARRPKHGPSSLIRAYPRDADMQDRSTALASVKVSSSLSLGFSRKAFTPPPPEGFISPMTWGVDTHIVEQFGQAGVPPEKISMVKDTFYFGSPDKKPGRSDRNLQTILWPHHERV
jgi:hypothetical protein